jgi:hypothetical protein
VTPGQVKAAQDQLEHDRLMHRESDPAVVKIARAVRNAVVHGTSMAPTTVTGTFGDKTFSVSTEKPSQPRDTGVEVGRGGRKGRVMDDDGFTPGR